MSNERLVRAGAEAPMNIFKRIGICGGPIEWSFSQKCLDLAKSFYPHTENAEVLYELAQQIQNAIDNYDIEAQERKMSRRAMS